MRASSVSLPRRTPILPGRLGYFDEIIVIDFPDDKEVQRKRVMTAEQQEALRARLSAL